MKISQTLLCILLCVIWASALASSLSWIDFCVIFTRTRRGVCGTRSALDIVWIWRIYVGLIRERHHALTHTPPEERELYVIQQHTSMPLFDLINYLSRALFTPFCRNGTLVDRPTLQHCEPSTQVNYFLQFTCLLQNDHIGMVDRYLCFDIAEK